MNKSETTQTTKIIRKEVYGMVYVIASGMRGEYTAYLNSIKLSPSMFDKTGKICTTESDFLSIMRRERPTSNYEFLNLGKHSIPMINADSMLDADSAAQATIIGYCNVACMR